MNKKSLCFTALLLVSSASNAQLDIIAGLPGVPDSVNFVPFSNVLTGLGLPALPIGTVPFSVIENIVVLETLALPPAPQVPTGLPELPGLPSGIPSFPNNLPLAGVNVIADMINNP